MARAASGSPRNWGARIRQYAWAGMPLVVLENEKLRVGVLAGKGTDVVELNYKPRDLDFAWISPHGLPSTVGSGSPWRDSLATFVETYSGGWQEVFPNGGAPSSHDGATFGQHDEVYALPWDVQVLEDSEDQVALRCTVHTYKVPCMIEKTIRLAAGTPGFRIEERVSNTSAVPVRAMWGHHITFGPPFLRPGCRIRLPDGVRVIPHSEAIAPGGRRIASDEPFSWPDAVAETGEPFDLGIIPDRGAPSDIAYLTGFPKDGAWYEIEDPDTGVGSRISWDAVQMPYLWYWQEFGATTGYPWYGRNYNIGLEPFSSYPTNGLADAVANGSALTLPPGEASHFWLEYTVLDNEE